MDIFSSCRIFLFLKNVDIEYYLDQLDQRHLQYQRYLPLFSDHVYAKPYQ